MEYFTHSTEFSFSSKALDPDTFGVVRFKGSEALSRPYEFDILLVSRSLNVDIGKVLQHPASFKIHREKGDDVVYHGILAELEQLNEFDEHAFYRARLLPRLWWLNLTHHNQIFLDQSVPQIIEAALKDANLSSADYEFRLQGSYSPLKYVCQYGESHLNFISRRLEREGIYYFFEQTPNGEKVVFTNTRIAHNDLPQGKTIVYSPPSGLEAAHQDETVRTFSCTRRLTPASVKLKDYNYMKPSLDIEGNAGADSAGRGEVYLYGEHFETSEEGNRLAKIRAEELLCKRFRYQGEGSVPYMAPGFNFDLSDHYRPDFNRKYTTVEINHEGNQAGYLTAGLKAGVEGYEGEPYYRNSFMAVSADVQFRPERASEAPRISGAISAKVDASGSGRYAELDSKGRYKVVMPFDLSERPGGKGSAWLRMAQPYAGSDHGMHFPLHKGTEVLLSFIDGDPDRPVIAGAVPNPETPSPVTDSNQTKSIVQTASGNRLSMEDQQGSERIMFECPTARSFIRMGQPNDPDWTPVDKPGQHGLNLNTPYAMIYWAAEMNSLIMGENTAVIGGLDNKLVAGGRADTTAIYRFNWAKGGLAEIVAGLKWACGTSWMEMVGMKRKVKGEQERAAAQRNAVIATNQKTVASLTKTLASCNKTIAANNATIASKERIIAAKDRVILARDGVIAEQTDTIAAKTQTIANQGEAIVQADDLIAAQNSVHANRVAMNGLHDQVAVSSNKIVGASNSIRALETIV